MADATSIEWTDATWNPVTGCTEVSPGCDNCYAKTFAERWRGTPGHYFERGFDVQLRPDKLVLPLTWRKPRRIFVNSMSDLFHDGVPDEYIARVFAVMAATPDHTYQVLTKRHGRMRSLLSRGELGTEGFPDMVEEAMAQFTHADLEVWPLRNVWVGVSVENQQWADIRVPALLDTPAAVRWLSCEPLLGPVDLDGPVVNGHRPKLTYWLTGRPGWGQEHTGPTGVVMQDLVTGPRIDWVVAGGESGRAARPMHPRWVQSLRDQCSAADIPFLFKQRGEWTWDHRGGTEHPEPAHYLHADGRLVDEETALADGGSWLGVWQVGKKAAGRELDGVIHDAYPAEVGRG